MIVVDCSALVDVLSQAPGSHSLAEVLVDEELHAPLLLDYEIVAATRGLTLGGHLTPGRAQDLLSDFDSLPIRRWHASDELRRRAFSLPNNLSTYDAAYVALAESLDCSLLTRDVRLSRASGHNATIIVRPPAADR